VRVEPRPGTLDSAAKRVIALNSGILDDNGSFGASDVKRNA
jgi:hypothetical protein